MQLINLSLCQLIPFRACPQYRSRLLHRGVCHSVSVRHVDKQGRHQPNKTIQTKPLDQHTDCCHWGRQTDLLIS